VARGLPLWGAGGETSARAENVLKLCGDVRVRRYKHEESVVPCQLRFMGRPIWGGENGVNRANGAGA